MLHFPAALLPWQPRPATCISAPSPARPPWVVPVLVFLSVLSPPGWLPAPGPLASSCVRVVSSSTRAVQCLQMAPAPVGPRTLCPLPLSSAGRGLSLPFLSCKEEGKCQGQQHVTDPTPAAVRGPKLVTCWFELCLETISPVSRVSQTADPQLHTAAGTHPAPPVAWWLLHPWSHWVWGSPCDSSLCLCKKGNLLALAGQVQAERREHTFAVLLENNNNLCSSKLTK